MSSRAATRASRASSPAASARRRSPFTSSPLASIRESCTYSYDDFVASYYEQVAALVAGGVDLLAVETGNDILVLKACLFAIDKYASEHNVRVPTIVSGTIYHPGGRTLFSQTPEAFYVAVSHFDALAVGFNCGVGEDLMRSAVEGLAQISRRPISVYPNAGLPDGMGGFRGVGMDGTAKILGEFATSGWVNLVGGCCGTTPEWIAAFDRAIQGVPPRRVPNLPGWSYFSGNEGAGRPAGDQLHHDRRALQHHRLAQVQTPDQGKPV